MLERINDNAYKIDLLGEYNVSTTFNVSDISLFDMDADSRMNLFEKRGNDMALEEKLDILAQGSKLEILAFLRDQSHKQEQRGLEKTLGTWLK